MTTFGAWAMASAMAAWCAFGVAFIAHRWTVRGRSPMDTDETIPGRVDEARKREPIAWAGTALQAIAFTCIWNARREPPGAPLIPGYPALDAAVLTVCIALAWMSTGLMIWAIRTLGRQWAVAARLVDGHELVTQGPYRFVRNPIYTGLFCLAMATAGVLSRPWTIVVGAPLFLAGTMVRVRAEERLLRARFGARYDDYARRVPALVPRFRP